MELEVISCADNAVERIIAGIIALFFGYMFISIRKIWADALETQEKALWKKPGSNPFKVEKFVQIRVFFFMGALAVLCGIFVICEVLYEVIICFFA